MNVEDTCRTEGLLAGLSVGREAITYDGQKVAAIVDRQVSLFQMADAGFNAVEQVRIEVFKGTEDSTDRIDIDGVSIPLDLRGVVPKNKDPVLIDDDGISRIVSDIDNSVTAWIITTIRAN